MQIPLNELRFGHEADPPLNIRKSDRDAQIPEMVSMIETHGQLYPLMVRTIKGVAYVEDGNRRLAAQRARALAGSIPKDHPIECQEVGAHSLPGEVSLVAAISPVPPHEADQLQAFSVLRDNGMTPEEIGNRYGIEPKRVEKILVLGSLSPMILDAWRGGLFRDGVEVVRAFTLAPSVADQERIFKRLKKQGALWPHSVKEEIGAGIRDTSRLLRFVSAEAYEAAGGKITHDLFGNDHVISDLDLLKKLGDAKISEAVEKLRGEGWGWAEQESDLPSHARYSWYQDAKQKGAKTPEVLKAKLGCIVEIDHEGKLEIRYGVQKPQDAKPKTDKKLTTKDKGPSEAAISKALMHRLSRQLTLAAREALAGNFKVGLPALLAGLQAGGEPIRVRSEGMDGYSLKAQKFEQAFKTTMEMDQGLQRVAASAAAAACVDMQNFNGGLPLAAGNKVLCEALGEAFVTYAVGKFNAGDFFNSAPKAFTLQCIRECENAEAAKAAEKLPKEARIKRAKELAVKAGWLPEPMRTSHYKLGKQAPAKKAARKPRK